MNAPTSQGVSAAPPLCLPEVQLNDKYQQTSGSVYMSGTQALVRLLILQHQRDHAAGLNTAGFVSGYRGSPLGALDQQLWAAKPHLSQHNIVFQPGLNEDLGATAVWGSQQVNLFELPRYQGVFGMWYGKGPGVDRCGDVFKHANAAGTSALGGVLAVAGDDHAAKSSTLPHQSDHIFKACLMPVIFPSSVQDILDLGIHAYAMSRYAGVWVGFKCVADIVESSARVDVGIDRVQTRMPTDFQLPPQGVSIRWPDPPLEAEARLLDVKLYAAMAYARANGLNQVVIDSPRPRLGLVASGKAFQDTRQALEDLGLTPQICADIGLALYKVGMVWPLEPEGLRQFATGLQEILVVEEKRQVIEYQIKEELYHWHPSLRPKVYGKFDERFDNEGRHGGEWSIPQAPWLLPAHHELNPALIARAIAQRLEGFELPERLQQSIKHRLQVISACENKASRPHAPVERKPYFCSGCPHNTSTKVPQGSRAMAGIGCHYMAVWMDRATCTYTQMGGEGVPWIGQAPFTETQHMFANLGDGTYFHSGILAIRAAVAARVNITYKLLYNDAVAMTGGQAIDGIINVPMLTRQLVAEGVSSVVLVSDEPEKYTAAQRALMAPGIEIHGRDRLDGVQKKLRETAGTTVLIYDQTCASEKRRRRKRLDENGLPLYPDPARRVLINPAVCEGCGDCSSESNCLSIEPLNTDFGVKRKINQSSCNKDFSCLNGLCPSLVTVEGGQLKKAQPLKSKDWPALPLPQWDFLTQAQPRCCIMVTGVGGTGVVTIGALLGMAAHLQGLGVCVLDMAGLAQKGGAVFSHVQIARSQDDIKATRIATGEADVLLGGDLIVSAGPEALTKLRPEAKAVVNTNTTATADFIKNVSWQAPEQTLKQDLQAAVGEGNPDLVFLQAQEWMRVLMGDTLYANPFLLGFAFQRGWIPLALEALEKAIELNGAQVLKNLEAFTWGRRAAVSLREVAAMVAGFSRGAGETELPMPESPRQQLERLKARFAEELTQYDNKTLAQRFLLQVQACEAVESKFQGSKALSLLFARTYFQVLYIKDEYEVARLHSAPVFLEWVREQFDGDVRLNFYLAPPVLAKMHPDTGRLVKKQYGPKMLFVFKWLSKLKFLRNTPFDPFFAHAQRKADAAWIVFFEDVWRQVQSLLGPQNIDFAVNLLLEFQKVRGFDTVRENNRQLARLEINRLLHCIILGQDKCPDIPVRATQHGRKTTNT